MAGVFLRLPGPIYSQIQLQADRKGMSVYEMVSKLLVAEYCPHLAPMLESPAAVRQRSYMKKERQEGKRTHPTAIPFTYPTVTTIPPAPEVCSHPYVKLITTTAGRYCACGEKV